MQRLEERLTKIDETLKIYLDFCRINRIDCDVLKPGEYEIGVFVPRKAIDNSIMNFSKELDEFSKIFGTFEEIATGKRSDLKLRSLSTSEPSFFIDCLPEIALFTSSALAYLLTQYEKYIKIKKHSQEIKKLGVPEKTLETIGKYTDNIIENEIEELITILMREFNNNSNDDGRTNELTISLRMSLNKITNRIDKGYHIEIRTGALNDTKPKEDSHKDCKVSNINKIINDNSELLRFINKSGEQILSLPENDIESKSD